MKTSALLLVLALLIASICIQCASCTSCWANESYISAVCTPPLGIKLSNVSEVISLVPAGRLECTNFTDFEGITEAGRTAAGVIVAILGALAQFFGFVLIKCCYKNKTVISFGIFQWIMSVSMWLVGMVVNFAVAGQPIFYYFSTTGGALLSVGLFLVLPVISQFGIGLSGAIISITILIANWIINQYGLCAQCSNSAACIVGVVLLLISAIGFLVVGIMKKYKNELALPYHDHDGVDGTARSEVTLPYHDHDGEHQPLQQEGSKKQRDFYPRHMSSLTPAEPIDANDHEQIDMDSEGNKNEVVWKRCVLAFASVLVGLCWGWQYVAIKFLRKCDDSSLFPCNSLAYLFGHLSGSLLVTSLMLIMLWSTLTIIKLLGSRDEQTCGGGGLACWRILQQKISQYVQHQLASDIKPIMIVSAVFAGILWGIGLVGQLAAESMITPGLATPITTIVFALLTSIFVLKEVPKLCKHSGSKLEPRSKLLMLFFGLSLLVSVVAMVVFIVGYTT